MRKSLSWTSPGDGNRGGESDCFAVGGLMLAPGQRRAKSIGFDKQSATVKQQQKKARFFLYTYYFTTLTFMEVQ